MAEPSIAEGIASILNPLATVAASTFTDQQKTQINMARIKAGKQPCTGRPDQPPDCPLPLFAVTGTSQTPEKEYIITKEEFPTKIVVGAIAGSALLIILVLVLLKK